VAHREGPEFKPQYYKKKNQLKKCPYRLYSVKIFTNVLAFKELQNSLRIEVAFESLNY
jgi:hypothetical protein